MRAPETDESCPLGMWLLMVVFLLLHVGMAWAALKWLPELPERAEARTTSGEVAR